MKRKLLLMLLILVAVVVFSGCTTTTDSGNGNGVTTYAFDWAYKLARNYAEDNWINWDGDTVLIQYACVSADEKCMLGRPRDDSRWQVVFQSAGDQIYVVIVDKDGDITTDDWGGGYDDIHYVTEFSNSKLEEMMTFCLDESNAYWQQWTEHPDDYYWLVVVFYSETYSEYVFEVQFWDGDDFEGDPWGWIGIDTDGSGSDYNILYSY